MQDEGPVVVQHLPQGDDLYRLLNNGDLVSVGDDWGVKGKDEKFPLLNNKELFAALYNDAQARAILAAYVAYATTDLLVRLLQIRFFSLFFCDFLWFEKPPPRAYTKALQAKYNDLKLSEKEDAVLGNDEEEEEEEEEENKETEEAVSDQEKKEEKTETEEAVSDQEKKEEKTETEEAVSDQEKKEEKTKTEEAASDQEEDAKSDTGESLEETERNDAAVQLADHYRRVGILVDEGLVQLKDASRRAKSGRGLQPVQPESGGASGHKRSLSDADTTVEVEFPTWKHSQVQATEEDEKEQKEKGKAALVTAQGPKDRRATGLSGSSANSSNLVRREQEEKLKREVSLIKSELESIREDTAKLQAAQREMKKAAVTRKRAQKEQVKAAREDDRNTLAAAGEGFGGVSAANTVRYYRATRVKDWSLLNANQSGHADERPPQLQSPPQNPRRFSQFDSSPMGVNGAQEASGSNLRTPFDFTPEGRKGHRRVKSEGSTYALFDESPIGVNGAQEAGGSNSRAQFDSTPPGTGQNGHQRARPNASSFAQFDESPMGVNGAQEASGSNSRTQFDSTPPGTGQRGHRRRHSDFASPLSATRTWAALFGNTPPGESSSTGVRNGLQTDLYSQFEEVVRLGSPPPLSENEQSGESSATSSPIAGTSGVPDKDRALLTSSTHFSVMPGRIPPDTFLASGAGVGNRYVVPKPPPNPRPARVTLWTSVTPAHDSQNSLDAGDGSPSQPTGAPGMKPGSHDDIGGPD